MEFDIHIEKIGTLDDIFGFYKYLVKKDDLQKHVLLESASENTKESLYSFIALEPDFMLEINQDQFKIYDITSERGENIRNYVESKDPAEERQDWLLVPDHEDGIGYAKKLRRLLRTPRPPIQQLGGGKEFRQHDRPRAVWTGLRPN